jgi:hypothetical protein
VVDVVQAAEVQRLVEDLAGREVAPELHLARGAEAAGQRAPRLRGQAQRAPVVAVAHEDGLDGTAVVGAEQGLDRAVARVRLVLEGQRGERDLCGQPLAQGDRQVGHRVVAAGAAGRPRPHLAGAEARLARRVQAL